jgi:protein-serine/threonine kinase
MPNVIKYYGSLMEGPRVWIIMEFAEGGSIRTLVRPVLDSAASRRLT